ncbi:aquaporin FA-CHIP-like [Engraulis encrasicolus]|uniref:aquaporin FA-CHIP-like n=1 Tax=Engraulis encrasicolus TaxID=184585 RepID=UPI002FCF137B
MICGAMGAVMYDFMLFPSLCGLAERVATLKGSRPLEQDTCGEPIKLKMVYWVGPMICGAMGAVMYDFMLFPRICGLAKRVATLKGSRPLEQDTCGKLIKLKIQGLFQLVLCTSLAIGSNTYFPSKTNMFYTGAEMNPARFFTPALFKKNFMNHWVYRVGPMICGAMGAVMYDFMLFPSLCDLAERVATLKDSQPLEQEPIKLKTQAIYRNPATKPGDAVASQNCYSSPLLPATQLFSSKQPSSSPPNNPALLLPAIQLSSVSLSMTVCMYALV